MQGPANQPAGIGLDTLETIADPSRESDWAVSGLGRSENSGGSSTPLNLDRPNEWDGAIL